MPITDSLKQKRLTILGSTGSIGVQALDVIEHIGATVTALTAHSNVTLIEEQIRRFRPSFAAMADEKAAAELRTRVTDLPVRIGAGMEGLCEAAALDTTMVLNSVVGMVGLLPTLTAIEAGHDIALANKETLVAGGALVMEAAAKKKVRILPVDSEHSAIFQCLQGQPPEKSIKRIILTASGGPFFGKTREQLKSVTLADALRHPNWSMGAKITIDSATMMNKGLELIEACWLFNMPAENMDILIHRESIVHSLVEYTDHSTIAQLGVPDMRIPIQYAITYPHRLPSTVPSLDLAEWGKLTFYKPDYDTFVCMNACKTAMSRGGVWPAAVNAANEQAVALFREGRIGFLEIGDLVSQTLDGPFNHPADQVQTILDTDKAVREWVKTRLV